MKCIVLNCTLKKSPETSHTQVFCEDFIKELEKHKVECELIRVVDYSVLPGIKDDEGEGDQWPEIREKIGDSEILVMASPTWLGQHSSIAMRVIERMDAMFWDKDEDGRPPAYNRVAGFLATGQSDGAKHTINEMVAALNEVGFTIPAQGWNYYNNGAGSGPGYAEAEPARKKAVGEWSKRVAANLVAVAKALKTNQIPPPPG